MADAGSKLAQLSKMYRAEIKKALMQEVAGIEVKQIAHQVWPKKTADRIAWNRWLETQQVDNYRELEAFLLLDTLHGRQKEGYQRLQNWESYNPQDVWGETPHTRSKRDTTQRRLRPINSRTNNKRLY